MAKNIVITAAIILCTAIILGAMAAHGLETNGMAPELIESFQKGVTYQFYAGFALLILGLSAEKFSFSLLWFARLTMLGVILFSCCIYIYCFHTTVPALKSFVIVVPFGGGSFIAAWVVFVVQLVRAKT